MPGGAAGPNVRWSTLVHRHANVMSETRIAHFQHYWEAELARGYLDDAGIPCRLVSDNVAGGVSYVGGLSGAALFVAEEVEDAARVVLESAGILGGDEDEAFPLAERDLPPDLRAEAADVEERLGKLRKEQSRHLLWMALGVTPAAVIPLVGLALEDNVTLMALLCVLVVLVEGFRWMRTSVDVRRLERRRSEIEEEAEGR